MSDSGTPPATTATQSWRDTVRTMLGPMPPEIEQLARDASADFAAIEARTVARLLSDVRIEGETDDQVRERIGAHLRSYLGPMPAPRGVRMIPPTAEDVREGHIRLEVDPIETVERITFTPEAREMIEAAGGEWPEMSAPTFGPGEAEAFAAGFDPEAATLRAEDVRTVITATPLPADLAFTIQTDPVTGRRVAIPDPRAASIRLGETETVRRFAVVCKPEPYGPPAPPRPRRRGIRI